MSVLRLARGSGVATDGLLQGGFLHAASGIRYKVFLRDGKAWISYDREHGAETSNEQSTLNGEKQLIYLLVLGIVGVLTSIRKTISV